MGMYLIFNVSNRLEIHRNRFVNRFVEVIKQYLKAIEIRL